MSSKRSATGPQGDKGSVKDFGMASTPDERPQRATAAQMANRKIRDVKKRRPISSPPGFGAPQQATPFSSIDPNTVSSFSSSQSQPQTNGFPFGQSQSFPGAGTNPGQPSQNGSSPFAFGSGVGASAFNFGSSFDSGPSTSNPFANMSTGGANLPSSGGGFGGFTGNMFSLGAPGNQGPNQQPLPSTGLFGSQGNNVNGASFGNATSGPSGPATPGATTSSFGQPTFGTAPSPSIFSQNPPARPSLFPQATSGGDDSTMQTSPDAKHGKVAEKPSIFGTAPPPQPGFGTSTSFGTTIPAATAPGTAAGSTSFGAQSPKPSVNPFQPSNPFQAASSSANVFNAPEINKEAEKKGTVSTSGGIFGGTQALSSNKPPPSGNLFAPKAASSAEQASFKETAPTGNLLSPKPPSSPAPASFKETAPATGMPAFGASQPPSTGSLFAPKPTTSEQPPSEGTTPGPGTPLFGASQPLSRGNLFTPKPASSAEQAPSKETAPGPGTPLFGSSQPLSTGNLFTPKPASSAEQAPSKEAAPSPGSGLFSPKPAAGPVAQEKPTEINTGNPFSSLLAHEPATPNHSAAQEKPAQEKAGTTQNPFGSLFIPPTESPAKKAQLSTPNGVPASTATPTTTTEKAPAYTQSGMPPFAKPTSTKRDPARALENLKPRKLPANLPKEFEQDYVLLFQVRTLNESFKREISKLDPAEDDFDRIVQFYVRVRDTLGIPLGFRKSKRKTPDESENVEDGPLQKKVRAFGTASRGQDAAGAATPPASGMKIGSSSTAGMPSNSFVAERPPAASHKRKSVDEGNDEAASSFHREKRTKEASTTASAFAQSFSNSATSEPDGESANIGTPKAPTFSPSKPSADGSGKPSLFSTTPAASPAKPLLPTPSTSEDAPAPTSLFSQSAQKRTESTSARPPAGPAFEIPKFGSGTSGGTNFLSQFKKQADQHSEKEKEKRKAEDYDSEEDDEAEWERKDAEEQRKKREELASLSQRRSKFVPGKGFVFEDESIEAPEPKEAESKESEAEGADQSVSSAQSEGKSVFEDEGKAPIREKNIFGHLSPNPLFGAKNERSGVNTPTSAPSALSPGFSFGAPTPQGSSVLTPSVPASDISRATTPGFTSDTGAEESGEGETEFLPQVELSRGGAGEENEDVILETRARGLQLKDGNWDSQGVGFLRILKDRTTSRARVLLRADPSGKVVLNALLLKGLEYQLSGTSVVFMVPQPEGPPQQWALRAKKGDADRIAAEMEAHKM